MVWSKVNKPLRKPIGWWYHKILCEFGYYVYSTSKYRSFGLTTYYAHLNKLCKYGFNLYGDKI